MFFISFPPFNTKGSASVTNVRDGNIGIICCSPSLTPGVTAFTRIPNTSNPSGTVKSTLSNFDFPASRINSCFFCSNTLSVYGSNNSNVKPPLIKRSDIFCINVAIETSSPLRTKRGMFGATINCF